MEGMSSNFCWHLIRVSFEMKLYEWLKALISCYSTFTGVFAIRFLKSHDFSFAVYLQTISRNDTNPQIERILSLDNCNALANEHRFCVGRAFFLRVYVLPAACILFLFSRFMACLRAIYINTWYMKIKLCNKICRWTTSAIRAIFGILLFRCSTSASDGNATTAAFLQLFQFCFRFGRDDYLISTPIFISCSFYLYNNYSSAEMCFHNRSFPIRSEIYVRIHWEVTASAIALNLFRKRIISSYFQWNRDQS